jgi:hypothetical protein
MVAPITHIGCMVAVPLVLQPLEVDAFGDNGRGGATGFATLMALCDAMVEIDAGLGAEVTAADVDCRRVSAGATTGRACARRAAKTAAATRSSQKGAAVSFLVLTIAPI